MKKLKRFFEGIEAYYILYTTGWHTLYFTPPDKKVMIRDTNGNVGYAIPCYYPFKVVRLPGDEKKPWGLRGTVEFYPDGNKCWDGSWLVIADGLNFKITGRIILWKEID